MPTTPTTFGSDASFVAAWPAIWAVAWSSSGWNAQLVALDRALLFAWSTASFAELRIPRPRADRLPESGATMPMTSVPLLVSQVLPPPLPPDSLRLVPHAVSPRAPARIAAVTIVRASESS